MALGVCIVAASAFSLTACPTPGPVAPDTAAALCISHRTAKQLACVDIYATKPEIDACRAKVRAELDCTADAGLDAADAAPLLIAPAVTLDAGADK